MKERPLETFYGNVGSTNRYGLETSLSWFPVESLAVRLAYTYSHFKYISVESFDAGVIYKNTWLPNSPQHQLYLECDYKITKALTAGASFEHVSSWYIDATNHIFSDGYGKTNPYDLFNIKLSYQLSIGSNPWHLFVNGRNIFNEKYYGFTEPDPDGNSYQPAPTAEWSVGLRFGFGNKQSSSHS
jgi:outer membrane receptor protein involved in Fe transport